MGAGDVGILSPLRDGIDPILQTERDRRGAGVGTRLTRTTRSRPTTATTSKSTTTVDASKVLNLKTTDKEILAMIKKTYGDSGNANDRALLQQLLGERSNNASLLSNMYKTLAETTRSIIQNIRT